MFDRGDGLLKNLAYDILLDGPCIMNIVYSYWKLNEAFTGSQYLKGSFEVYWTQPVIPVWLHWTFYL